MRVSPRGVSRASRIRTINWRSRGLNLDYVKDNRDAILVPPIQTLRTPRGMRPPIVDRVPRPGVPRTAPVGLRGPGELVGHLPVVALHPDGFSISEREDADMIGVGRVGAESHHIHRVDVHGGASSGVHKLCN